MQNRKEKTKQNDLQTKKKAACMAKQIYCIFVGAKPKYLVYDKERRRWEKKKTWTSSMTLWLRHHTKQIVIVMSCFYKTTGYSVHTRTLILATPTAWHSLIHTLILSIFLGKCISRAGCLCVCMMVLLFVVIFNSFAVFSELCFWGWFVWRVRVYFAANSRTQEQEQEKTTTVV